MARRNECCTSLWSRERNAPAVAAIRHAGLSEEQQRVWDIGMALAEERVSAHAFERLMNHNLAEYNVMGCGLTGRRNMAQLRHDLLREEPYRFSYPEAK